jgi:CubicO group peptidase (beta-lactamase class C family)
VLKPETMERARTPLTSGNDKVLFFETKFGLGFMTNSLYSPVMTDGGFGHYGAGGSVGFAVPELGVAFAYVMNKMQTNLAGDARTLGLIDAVRQAVS